MKSIIVSRCHGFSLVEVALAMGIVSFAFVSLYGLLPVGLESYRKSLAMTIETQIAQSLITQAQQTDFANLPQVASVSSSTPTYYYFDQYGGVIPAASKTHCIYSAAISYDTSTNLPAEATTSTVNLVNLKIKLYNNRGTFDKGGLPIDVNYASFSLHLANFGQRL